MDKNSTLTTKRQTASDLHRIALRRKTTLPLPQPTRSQIHQANSELLKNPDTASTERALGMTFGQYPRNTRIEEVLIKVTLLNTLYSTNIYDVRTVSRHIVQSKVDAYLKRGDPEVVGIIASVKFGGQARNIYSFATKYCSCHRPDEFPLYDRYVCAALAAYRKESRFYKFSKASLKDYSVLLEVLRHFRQYYHLPTVSMKDLDKFLWWVGRLLSAPEGLTMRRSGRA